MRERLMRDLRKAPAGFGGRFSRLEVWRDALQSRKDEWVSRCGEGILFSAFKWAHQADSTATLTSAEGDILTTQTLTNAEAYHNLMWEMSKNRGVPVGGIGVRANFSGEVDASTVKHRLDVLKEVELPVYITDFSISNLDPAKHAYELEKFLRIAFSHEAVAGITMGDLWDKGNPRPSSGLYAANKQPKPAASKLEQLWSNEWTTRVEEDLATARGVLDFEGFYGTYQYEVRATPPAACSRPTRTKTPTEPCHPISPPPTAHSSPFHPSPLDRCAAPRRARACARARSRSRSPCATRTRRATGTRRRRRRSRCRASGRGASTCRWASSRRWSPSCSSAACSGATARTRRAWSRTGARASPSSRPRAREATGRAGAGAHTACWRAARSRGGPRSEGRACSRREGCS